MASSGTLRQVALVARVVLTRATRRNIPEDAIIHSHRNENLKSHKYTKGLIVHGIQLEWLLSTFWKSLVTFLRPQTIKRKIPGAFFQIWNYTTT
jgi:hypothetical protein